MLKRLIQAILSLFRTSPSKPGRVSPSQVPSTPTTKEKGNERNTAKADHSEPAWLQKARNEDGTVEAAGKANNPRIVEYFIDIGSKFRDDETAWCAAFVGACLKRAGQPHTGSTMARSYLNYGQKLDNPKIGAIVVLKRGNDPTFGHVGFVVGWSASSVFVLGGNQWNKETKRSEIVNVSKFPHSQVLGYRWPPSMAKSEVVKGVATSAAGQALQQGAQPTADLFTAMGAELKLLDGIAPKLALLGAFLTIAGLLYAYYARWKGMKENGI
jgi:uncharacterized protein (TIGR02594 family)